MPVMGVGMEEGLILRWLKQPGDLVQRDEPIVEIETDKASVDLLSPTTGRLGEHLYPAEALVPVGTTIAVVHEDDDLPPTR